MDLRTTYLGLDLKNPVIASASPLSRSLEGIKRLEDSGVSAVVMYSLFEEQITRQSLETDYYLSHGTESYAEAMTYFPDQAEYNTGPDEYVELIAAAKEATSVPIIGSLNGVSPGGWMDYARLIEQAGADALELNIYYVATDPDYSSASIEQRYYDAVSHVRETINLPIAVKVSPFFTSMAHVARGLVRSGADGLVLFNRFYQPDFNLDTQEVVPSVDLSTSQDMRIPLRWTAILYGQIPADLAITGGVHTHKDVLKAMMAGASATMLASEILAHGYSRVGEILRDMTSWMEEFEYTSVAQMRGSMSQRHVAEPAAFERANYMKVLQSFRLDEASWRV